MQYTLLNHTYKKQMLAGTNQKQNTSANIHRVAYQNKTSSSAIYQGW